MARLDAVDPTFKQDLLHSVAHVNAVAKKLREKGYTVEVPETECRPTSAQWRQYSDDGDMIVNGERVEVKERRFTFETLDQFPYPTCIVDTKHAVDKMLADERPPLCHIITNKGGTCCFVVPFTTKAEWEVKTKYDRYRNRQRTLYEAPMNSACDFDTYFPSLIKV